MRRKYRSRSKSSRSSSSLSSYRSSQSRSISRESDRSRSNSSRPQFKIPKRNRSRSRTRSSSIRRSRFDNSCGQRGYKDRKRQDFPGPNRRDARNWNGRNEQNCVPWNHHNTGGNENAMRRYGNEICPGVYHHNQASHVRQEVPYPTQPPKLTFKQYVFQMDDRIDEIDGSQRYKTYVLNFVKDQINAFFESHKNEDWFRRKYFSEEFELRQKEKEVSFKHRKDVFMNLLKNDSLENVTLDSNSNDKLEKLLDLASSLMEDELETKSSQVKIQSIFLKNINPKIAINDILSVCQNFPGFVRLCIQDPEPQKKFFRKGWITFDGSVDIISTCEQINKTRIGECDMGATVNRELRQRLRAVNGLSVHKFVAKQDIKHAAKIIEGLDKKWKMWENDAGDVKEHPLMKNAAKYLVDEIDYEEAILGDTMDRRTYNEIVDLQKDNELLNVLDGMLLYLRIVYSIDYYGAFEYYQEDEMPHRCGIIHVRGINLKQQFTKHEVDKHLKMQDNNMQPFLNRKFEIDKAEAVTLGLKNQEEEIEKFISRNTQELEKDKWLCPLSGKKFKGPEFIKKHILTKHEDKIEDVKKEITYFNNFVCDPNRPSLPEHPSNQYPALLPAPPQPSFDNFHDRFTNGVPPGFNVHPPCPRRERYSPNMAHNRNQRQVIDRRPLVSYHDYDAVPDEPEY